MSQFVQSEYPTIVRALAATNAHKRRSPHNAPSAGVFAAREASLSCAPPTRATTFHSGIHRSPSTPVIANAVRHPYVTAHHVANGGAAISPRLTPIWFIALPSARSDVFKYLWIALPAEGIPPASATPNTVRHPINPLSPLVNPVAIPAHDHSP